MILFKTVFVFDRAQVEPIEGRDQTPLGPPSEPLKARRILVDSGQQANAQLRILIHETIHALGVGYAEYGRARAEVIVDTATHLVCSSVGLRVDGETVAYVAGWGEDGALEAVTGFAKTIDELARRVENVLSETAAEREAA